MNKVFIIHPQDSTTKFLKKISNRLGKLYGDSGHCVFFSVKPNDKSHSDCIAKLLELDNQWTILFLGHGRTDFLHGAKGDLFDDFFHTDDFMNNSPDLFYYKENFINANNISCMKNKNFLSLSCNSTGKIGRIAIENGALGFIGFGNIPSSVGEILEYFDEEDVRNVNLDNVLSRFKGVINRSIIDALSDYISLDIDFSVLRKLIRFRINQHLTHELMNKRRASERRLLIILIQDYRNNIASIFP